MKFFLHISKLRPFKNFAPSLYQHNSFIYRKVTKIKFEALLRHSWTSNSSRIKKRRHLSLSWIYILSILSLLAQMWAFPWVKNFHFVAMLFENAHLQQMLMGNTFKIVVFTGSVSKDIYSMSCCLELSTESPESCGKQSCKNCPTEMKYIKRSKVMKKALEIVVVQN